MISLKTAFCIYIRSSPIGQLCICFWQTNYLGNPSTFFQPCLVAILFFNDTSGFLPRNGRIIKADIEPKKAVIPMIKTANKAKSKKNSMSHSLLHVSNNYFTLNITYCSTLAYTFFIYKNATFITF